MNEKEYKPVSGYLILVIDLLLFIFGIWGLTVVGIPLVMGMILIIALFLMPGFFFIYPNGSRVLTLFGAYKGTVKINGFFWVNPFYMKKSSLCAHVILTATA